jgi:hypothetical protein
VVLKTFSDSMATLSFSLSRLILEAESQLVNLESLETALTTIHTIITRENLSITSAKSELLSELWTILGGNRKQLRGFNEHLELLQGLGVYRMQALQRVVDALEHLRVLSDDMEELRERVTAPRLGGESIPVEVHLGSIRIGMERLKDSRVRAREKEERDVRGIVGDSGED